MTTARTYYGTKQIKAEPMTRADYNAFRGWELPADKNGADEGYLVEYLDGGKPNVEGRDGYVSWSPKEQFDNAYQPTNALSFGHALVALSEGKAVARKGWNGKDQFVYDISAKDLCASLKYGYGEYQHEPEILSTLAIKTSANQIQIGWLASQSDMKAKDWFIVGED